MTNQSHRGRPVDARPGRPSIDPHESSVSTHVRLPATQYDNLYQLAQRERCSVPELIRRCIRDQRQDDDEE